MLKNFQGTQFKDIEEWKKIFHFSGPLNYLEIGAFHGANLICVLRTFGTDKGSKLHCIDPWIDYDDYDEYKGIQNKNFGIFMNNLDKLENEEKEKIVIHRGFSHQEVLKLPDDYFHMIYIDGNHNPEYVLEDAVLSFRKLKKGGLLIFDDYGFGGADLTKKGIDSFMNAYSKKIELLHIHNGQVFIKKLECLIYDTN